MKKDGNKDGKPGRGNNISKERKVHSNEKKASHLMSLDNLPSHFFCHVISCP